MNPTIPAVPTSSHVPRAAVVGPKIKISPRHGTTSVGPMASVAYPTLYPVLRSLSKSVMKAR